MCRHTVPYARLMQEMQGPKQASNLMHVDHATHSSHVTDHFLSTLLSLRYIIHALRCVLLEITLNTGIVVLEGAATRRGDRTPPRCAVHPPSISRPNALADRIVSYRDILSDIVSYLSFSLMAVSCHHYCRYCSLYVPWFSSGLLKASSGMFSCVHIL